MAGLRAGLTTDDLRTMPFPRLVLMLDARAGSGESPVEEVLAILP